MIGALGPGAAFYDLDGTLVRTNLVHVLLFYARNDRGLLKSLQRTAVSVAGIPLFFAAERVSRQAFNEVFFRFFRGLTADRLRLLAEELWEQVLEPALRPDAGTVFIDTDSAPRVLHCGESLLEARLPVGTRVVYPRPPIAPVSDAHEAIREAIENPLGCDPLPAQLRPGMRVTIAMDDISLPLPPMERPDVRQTALQVLLPILAEAGVDDIHLLVANSRHRKMTESQMRRPGARPPPRRSRPPRTDVPPGARRPGPGRGRLRRPRPAQAARGAAGPRSPPPVRPPRLLPAAARSLRPHRLLGRAHGAGARAHARTVLRAVRGGRGGTVRRADRRSPLHLSLQRQLDPQPRPRPGDGSRLPLQPVPGPPARAAGRRAHPGPSLLRRVRHRVPSQLRRVLPPPAVRGTRRLRAARAVRGVGRPRPALC